MSTRETGSGSSASAPLNGGRVACVIGVVIAFAVVIGSSVVAHISNQSTANRRARMFGRAGYHQAHESTIILSAIDTRNGRRLSQGEILSLQKELHEYHAKLRRDYTRAAEDAGAPIPIEPSHPLADQRGFLDVLYGESPEDTKDTDAPDNANRGGNPGRTHRGRVFTCDGIYIEVEERPER